ncbi:MAG: site-specific DNA-methyltransferase [Clostridiales bacterium]|jgi:DNA modification methylase|nr:site-specific DNA-methyltransferase [Clostridiales bacterium]
MSGNTYNKIICGDALAALKTLPPESVNTAITSPPYYGLRDYGAAGQIGLEKTPEQYISRLVGVFNEVKRVLRADGTLWVNIADCYAGSRKGAALYPENAKKYKQGTNRGLIGQKAVTAVTYGECKEKDLVGIPWLLAFALRAAGWYLRQSIIWAKPNPMPESVKDRCTRSHEYIFMFSKSPKYYYDAEAIKEQALTTDAAQPRGSLGTSTLNGGRRKQDGAGNPTYTGFNARYFSKEPPLMRNKRDVWTVAPHPDRTGDAHFATFPVELITPCVLAGCPEGGVVLDPFSGSGTTGAAAVKYNRKYILIDISAPYIEIAKRRLAEAERQLTVFNYGEAANE